MLAYLRLPLLFFFIASLLGVVLRFQVIAPSTFLNYSNVLHGHSHIMFLGWVFNVLYIGLVSNHIPVSYTKPFIRVFWVLQLLTVGMLFSFPLQGYGVLSIVLTTLHTLFSFVFIALFFVHSKKDAGTSSLWFARVSLILFTISAVGPFFLAYLMVTDPANILWRNYSIYFYLHFQYNGFFLFGTISLLLRMVENIGVEFSPSFVKKGKWLAFATVPAYLLSVLFSKPALIYNVIGGLAALIQVILFTSMSIEVCRKWGNIKHAFQSAQPFVFIAGTCLGLKFFLQLISALPAAAQLAFDLRPVVIAYLHLVLIGVITFSLLAWYHAHTRSRSNTNMIFIIFVLSFVLMELTLVAMPWWTVFEKFLPNAAYILLVISLVLSSCICLWLFALAPPQAASRNCR